MELLVMIPSLPVEVTEVAPWVEEMEFLAMIPSLPVEVTEVETQAPWVEEMELLGNYMVT
jgi:hypothetical protein